MSETSRAALAALSPAELRQRIRAGQWTGPTTGLAQGFVQTNLVILPLDAATEFAEFCLLNHRACPLVAQTAVGDPEPRAAAKGSDLRTDVPRYRVFRHGQAQAAEPTEIRDLWQDDFVSFLLGCSFTFETALRAAGIPVRHIEAGHNVAMYRTDIDCEPAGRFRGKLVVSMRPFAPEVIDQVVAISGRYPTMHGAPLHIGDPSVLGIADLARPEYGEPVAIAEHEVPVFWGCGVTPQVALLAARLPLAITHSPGCMFVTDLPNAQFEEDRAA